MPTGDPMCSSCGNYSNMCNCIRVPVQQYGNHSYCNCFLENQKLKEKISELEIKLEKLDTLVSKIDKYLIKQDQSNRIRKSAYEPGKIKK